MSYTKYDLPAKSISYGGSRSASAIKYLIFHYTGNTTDTAWANANYFSKNGSNTRSAGAHYFVDGTSVYQSIDDLKVAYSVGGSRQSSSGGSMYGTITNTNSISIEMCSTGGMISAATIANAVALGKLLMQKYNIPIGNVYRHWDVNGKACPGWSGWTGSNASNASKWTALKNALSGSSGASTTTSSGSYLVRITASVLNVREGAGTSYAIVTTVKKGDVYTIVGESNGWGKLKSGAGWIKLSYTTKI